MTPSDAPLVFAVVQMNSTTVLEDNLTQAVDFIGEAAAGGADIVALPENFSLMPDTDRQRQDAAQRAGEVEALLSAAARDQDVVIIGGSTPFPAEDGRVTNTCLVFDRSGKRIGRYDKMHLFDVSVSPQESYRESAYIAPGDRPLAVTVDDLTIGITICYDLRFPELYRALGVLGAEIFSVPSAFTVPTGRAHWHTLLRARAVENLAWVLAPAQVGTHPGGRETFGHSLIIDPWGSVLAENADGPGVILARVDRNWAREKRRHFPVLEHKVLK
jgi:nitrilase